MKTLLIATNVAQTPYPVYPLGMAIVAAALRAAGHETAQFDFLQNDASLEAVAQAVRRERPDLVGLSMRNIDNVNMMNEQRYVAVVRDIAQIVRRECGARIVLGGSAFSILPETLMTLIGADYGVRGEGESAAVELADSLAAGCPPPPGTILDGIPLEGARIPSAAYDPDVLRHYLASGTVASLQTKRGCPYRCVYCSYPYLEGHTVRARCPEAVADDFARLVAEHGARNVFFTDSVFNDPGGAWQGVVDALIARGLDTPWTAFFKPGALDDEQVARMRQAGLRSAEIGSDAACDTTLRGLGKAFTFDDVVACNRLFLRHDVAPAHFFMFGGPGETRATVAESLENLKRLEGAALFAFMGIRIVPHTPLAARALREGLIAPDTPLLEPVYYLAPGIERGWLEDALTREFARHRNWIFPPDKLDGVLRYLHKSGHTGSLWDMLQLGQRQRPPRQRPRI
jgi:lipid biosynthesis B12-binding/radical SAM protein